MALLVPSADLAGPGSFGVYGSGSARYDRLNGGASSDDANGVSWPVTGGATPLEFSLSDPAVGIDTGQPVTLKLRATATDSPAVGTCWVQLKLYQGGSLLAEVDAGCPVATSGGYTEYTASVPSGITDGAALTCTLTPEGYRSGTPLAGSVMLFVSEISLEYTEGAGSANDGGDLLLLGVG